MAAPSADQQEAWRALVMASHVLAEALDRQSRRDGGLPHTYYTLLVTLFESGEHRLRMSQLAAELRCSTSRLTHAVSSLERSGLVERVRSTEDRRVQHLVLTHAGEDMVRRVTPGQVREVRLPVLAALDPADTADLLRLSRLVTAALEPDDTE
ncbi:MarR family transcriptional regulator [soil metagenome]